MTSELRTSQKLISSSRLRAVMSRVSVVAGATYDCDSGDSNLGCTLSCLMKHYSFLVEYAPSLLLFALFSSYVQTIGSCGFVAEPSIYRYSPPHRGCMTLIDTHYSRLGGWSLYWIVIFKFNQCQSHVLGTVTQTIPRCILHCSIGSRKERH